MFRLSSVALLSAFAFSLFQVQAAESAPSFPIDMEIEYCWGDDCYDMFISVESDGTFIDSDGDGGVWFYRPSERSFLLRYEGDATGVEFYGIRTGDCFAGTTILDGAADAEWVGCRQ